MSFTRDGMLHFFAKPGIEDLTKDDHIGSQFSYGYKCQRFKTFFFNVCNGDNGRTWSTPFIIDDPRMYYIPTETARVIGKRGTGGRGDQGTGKGRRRIGPSRYASQMYPLPRMTNPPNPCSLIPIPPPHSSTCATFFFGLAGFWALV